MVAVTLVLGRDCSAQAGRCHRRVPAVRPAQRGSSAVVSAAAGGAQMPDDRCPIEVVEGVPVVAAPAEIDMTTAEALRSALLTAAANGRGTLVVDMARTRFCDSSGLHTLIAAHKRAESEDG